MTKSYDITLETPIPRGDDEITTLTLTFPDGTGWLRGIKIFELVQMDVAALTTVLPRLVQPTLTESDIRQRLSPADLFLLGAKVADFLVPQSVRAESQTA